MEVDRRCGADFAPKHRHGAEGWEKGYAAEKLVGMLETGNARREDALGRTTRWSRDMRLRDRATGTTNSALSIDVQCKT